MHDTDTHSFKKLAIFVDEIRIQNKLCFLLFRFVSEIKITSLSSGISSVLTKNIAVRRWE